jgi:hypothetical protein
VDAGGGGTALEGEPCTTSSECASGLACVDGGFLQGVCGRPCDSAADCGFEECASWTGNVADNHCVNVVRDEFGLCGAGMTAVCEGRTCFYPAADSLVGVCVNTCEVAPVDGSDGGTDDDAGADAAAECSAGQICFDIEFSAEGATNEGICVTEQDRGDECGIDLGFVCRDGDACVPADAAGTTLRCYEDCTESGECAKGTCTDGGDYNYCAE